MTPFQMAQAALRRPPDFHRMSPAMRWEVDKSLGILDWMGLDLERARETINSGDAAASAALFGMTLPELRTILEGFEARGT